jgi:hypothetical protein
MADQSAARGFLPLGFRRQTKTLAIPVHRLGRHVDITLPVRLPSDPILEVRRVSAFQL